MLCQVEAAGACQLLDLGLGSPSVLPFFIYSPKNSKSKAYGTAMSGKEQLEPEIGREDQYRSICNGTTCQLLDLGLNWLPKSRS